MHPQRGLAALAASALIFSGVAACGSDDDTSPSTTPMTTTTTTSAAAGSGITPTGTGNPFADARTAAAHMPMTAEVLAGGFAKTAKVAGDLTSPAAQLRATLTQLLQEHVYLAGIAVATAYAAGADSAEFKLAGESLDASSVDVSKAVGSIVGPEKEKVFLQAWRSHVTNFVNYAVAAKKGDAAGKAKEVASLTAYAKAQGEFFSEATGGGLPAAAVEKEFLTHITSLATAVDAFAAGDVKGYELLRTAAGHMSHSAQALAGGIAPAAKLAGNPNDAQSELRSGLVALLQEHVYIAGVAVFTAYTAGADSAAFKAAAAQVDANSVALSKAVGSLSPASEKPFLESWRSHVTDFVSYAVALAKKDTAGAAAALKNLDGYKVAAADFLAPLTGLPASALEADLKMHIETTAGVIDSLAKALVK